MISILIRIAQYPIVSKRNILLDWVTIDYGPFLLSSHYTKQNCKLLTRLDLPTPESPRRTILKIKSYDSESMLC